MKALAALVTEFSEGVATMVDHQSYMRQREEHHRDMTESTNAKVLWWTIGESTRAAAARALANGAHPAFVR